MQDKPIKSGLVVRSVFLLWLHYVDNRLQVFKFRLPLLPAI